MPDVLELLAHAQELQPRSFTPDPLIGLERPKDGRARARRRTLEALTRELAIARESRAEWYVWVTEEWPRIKGGLS